jgi:hypothetical protein
MNFCLGSSEDKVYCNVSAMSHVLAMSHVAAALREIRYYVGTKATSWTSIDWQAQFKSRDPRDAMIFLEHIS